MNEDTIRGINIYNADFDGNSNYNDILESIREDSVRNIRGGQIERDIGAIMDSIYDELIVEPKNAKIARIEMLLKEILGYSVTINERNIEQEVEYMGVKISSSNGLEISEEDTDIKVRRGLERYAKSEGLVETKDGYYIEVNIRGENEEDLERVEEFVGKQHKKYKLETNIYKIGDMEIIIPKIKIKGVNSNNDKGAVIRIKEQYEKERNLDKYAELERLLTSEM